ncbi:hypothetical protein DIPPA_18884 [Diplonema papillatum]|nr:hypothetical protein DIPPA_18884 [Diplonema papillatum]
MLVSVGEAHRSGAEALFEAESAALAVGRHAGLTARQLRLLLAEERRRGLAAAEAFDGHLPRFALSLTEPVPRGLLCQAECLEFAAILRCQQTPSPAAAALREAAERAQIRAEEQLDAGALGFVRVAAVALHGPFSLLLGGGGGAARLAAVDAAAARWLGSTRNVQCAGALHISSGGAAGAANRECDLPLCATRGTASDNRKDPDVLQDTESDIKKCPEVSQATESGKQKTPEGVPLNHAQATATASEKWKDPGVPQDTESGKWKDPDVMRDTEFAKRKHPEDPQDTESEERKNLQVPRPAQATATESAKWKGSDARDREPPQKRAGEEAHRSSEEGDTRGFGEGVALGYLQIVFLAAGEEHTRGLLAVEQQMARDLACLHRTRDLEAVGRSALSVENRASRQQLWVAFSVGSAEMTCRAHVAEDHPAAVRALVASQEDTLRTLLELSETLRRGRGLAPAEVDLAWALQACKVQRLWRRAVARRKLVAARSLRAGRVCAEEARQLAPYSATVVLAWWRGRRFWLRLCV